MSDYPLIADHGLIGDLQTSALVATDGTVDWFCAPRFDSPSTFGALLDQRRGGHCRIRPTVKVFTSKQLYYPDTAVLVTRFMTEAGVGEVIDFMPVTGTVATARHQLVRLLRCVRGEMTFSFDIAPRFDYGREPHETRLMPDGAVFEGRTGTSMTANLIRDPEDEYLARARVDDHGNVHGEATLRAGLTRGLVLETGVAGPIRQIPVAEAWRLLEETVDFWKSWIGRSTYRGRWREALNRSAITLKLMTYAPSGAFVAAPTAGLPEQIGGERNWDYRYTWVRDASFSVYSLLGLGFSEEAAALGRWLAHRVDEQAGAGRPLKVMYRVDGSSDLTEEILADWEGYRGSAPVRIGNDAADQLQLDIYGEALDSIWVGDRHGILTGHHGWRVVSDILNWVSENWDQAEEGIWETRGGRQDFTYGRLMNWVALDRGIRLATEHGRPAPVDRWREQRDAIYDQVMDRGWSASRQAFRQHYETDVLDASLLRMTAVGFIAPTDPMWLSTLDAMDRELVTDSLVYRYDPAASPDGLRGSEGTFSLCTFAYVDSLARAGRLDKARVVFEKMLTYANHLGLYSEEIALTGEQIGNFPQAFTHLALIDAAITLDRQLDLHPPAASTRPTAVADDPSALPARKETAGVVVNPKT
ncbi:glycoside hydrolase family 15 protein [Kutzneria kofuensis]|uniref:Pentatricopeptide repeat protein n=1 Tax=Kutzneria kofuensis TaxID=103725 RepID=A0A7W9NMS3_9PSEU|nr:glycoside hydrolase family 15 protein [Kutzneria kofuensis]MBB5897846.1 pentatricopeptide repeat protein [Kutzneria kofuensis]